MNTTRQFASNGINGATGEYLSSASHLSEIMEAASSAQIDRITSDDVRRPIASVDPTDLSQAGWGIIFAAVDKDIVSEICEALAPLLTLRQTQAGGLYYIYKGPNAYRPDESKNSFLRRHRVGRGPVDPTQMPYYLLLVGSPRAIPYEFQAQLDVQFAVGRIYFETIEEYANYAQSIAQSEKAQAEKGSVSLPRREACFFGPHNPDDLATKLSATELIQPLATKMAQVQSTWDIQQLTPEQSDKATLSRLLGGPETPRLLFTASHGMGFPMNDRRQLPHQGALLCQDWPGPQEHKGPIPQDFYLAADDIPDDANLQGMLCFNFACYSAGTPREDQYAFEDEPTQIAPQPFISRLPQRLLGHPKGGALAVIGHVDRAWGHSFRWPGVESQTQTFESTLTELMKGYPIGHAMSYFNERYAELATELNQYWSLLNMGSRRGRVRSGGLTQERTLELLVQWTAYHDARDYMIFGDPAVRLSLDDGDNRVRSATPSDIPPDIFSQVDRQADVLTVSTYVGDEALIHTQIDRAGQTKNRLARTLSEDDNRVMTLHQNTLAEAIKVWRS